MTFTVTDSLIAVYQAVLGLGKTSYFNLIFNKGFVLIYSEIKEMFKLNILRTDCSDSDAFRMPVEIMAVIMKPGIVEIKEVEKENYICLVINHYTGSICDICITCKKQYCKEKEIINDYFKLLMKVGKDERDTYKKYSDNTDYTLGLAACKILDSESQVKGVTYSNGIAYVVSPLYYCYFKVKNKFDMSISKDALSGLIKFTGGRDKYYLLSYKGMNICIVGSSMFGWRRVRSVNMDLDSNFKFEESTTVNYMNTLPVIESICSDVKNFDYYPKDNIILINTLNGEYRVPIDCKNCPVNRINIPFKLFKSLIKQPSFSTEITYNNIMVQFKIELYNSEINFIFVRGEDSSESRNTR